ncbi:type II secretion system minor pseudopilin GspI [Vibrio salinus]|uniref:type II secretion system minor pseudopilin GspI n=1 Tax=Vibrio salinus TaxID=2899784 RepID=UPI001E51D1BE|nr:type II secretion system minor pseudopilin GspI [Vibrio salinus]MCE0493858.1 type II secretion system minor pseudopilin GspI [Vibrio salinus]
MKGMTLLEVLVALAIFATASLSVIRAVNQNLDTESYLEEKMFASLVADNQVALLMLNPKNLSTHSGTSEMANQTWYWKVTVVPTENEVLQAFEVSVSAQKKSSSIVTVRSYVPKSS